MIAERERIDSQVRELRILRDAGEITPDQQLELLDLQRYLPEVVDNVAIKVDTESKPSNAISTAMMNLRMGIWHLGDGAGGVRSYDEMTLETKKISGFDSP